MAVEAMGMEVAVVMVTMTTTVTMVALVVGMMTMAAMKNMISTPQCRTAWHLEEAVAA